MTTKTTNENASHQIGNMMKSFPTRKSEVKNPYLHSFFITSLNVIYFAENDLIDFLENMGKATMTEELKDVLECHQLKAKKQVSHLKRIFKLLDEKPEKIESEFIKDIINENNKIMNSTEKGSVKRDASFIIATQKVLQYKMITYKGLTELALTVGQDRVANLLEKILDVEKIYKY
ncbi:DUF892 family protein [Chryseobacterium potabilaquae]|uniref:Uncharacterized protein n=1 Tax=Chryseobacterium potabilaquae TaxID=2675057 RepID=A0A6N4X9N4_9FLAO|nr:DUF892 family protein [Chryseobacterium potabilaquae]CAA7197495.1 hypothetical protein CHRY9293_03560 [Chryseobacterium potabilaquae]